MSAASDPRAPTGTGHRWQFFRAGGVDQVAIRSGEDLARLGELDQKLWVALACPTRGVEFDTRTLDLIDTDHDGRIRPPELIAACEWACARLADADLLLAPGDSLPISAIAIDGAPSARDAGPGLADAARRVLARAGKTEAQPVALADVLQCSEHLAALRFNGDGVVTPATAQDDAALADVLRRIAATQGSMADAGGEPGVDRSRAKAFFDQARALRQWQAGGGDGDTGCGGPGMLQAAEAVAKVRAKVDDFFTRCRLAGYDIQAVHALNANEKTYEALAAQPLHLGSDGLAALPLAPVSPRGVLPLGEGVNPAWAEPLRRLRDHAVRPWIDPGADTLDEAGWQAIQARVAHCEHWLAAKPSNALSSLAPEKIEALAEAEGAVMALIDQDEQAKDSNAQLLALEKLLRLRRDLLTLVENFVSFRAFYRREGAIFQAGTLYLDARSCDLTVHVADVKQHAVLAGLAKTCLAYCDCTRQGKKITIVAAFTAGDVDFLFVGRNGVFYDRQGRDWDATITRLIENPTSVAQAFFSPYKKFVRVIEEQVARRAAASDAKAQGALSSVATSIAKVDPSQPVPATAAAPGATAPAARIPGSRIDVGTVAAIGVAMGSISAVLVALFSKFIDLGQWIPIAIAGMVLAISGPSMLIAWLKLRQRSLGPILDASGWAINGRMKVNVRLGASLSQTAHLPPHASRQMRDPYAERRAGATVALAVVLMMVAAVIAWELGWVPGSVTGLSGLSG